MVTITGIRQGRCLVSGKQGAVVDVEFQGGTLKGPLSFKSLEKLLRARAEGPGPSAPAGAQPQ